MPPSKRACMHARMHTCNTSHPQKVPTQCQSPSFWSVTCFSRRETPPPPQIYIFQSVPLRQSSLWISPLLLAIAPTHFSSLSVYSHFLEFEQLSMAKSEDIQAVVAYAAQVFILSWSGIEQSHNRATLPPSIPPSQTMQQGYRVAHGLRQGSPDHLGDVLMGVEWVALMDRCQAIPRPGPPPPLFEFVAQFGVGMICSMAEWCSGQIGPPFDWRGDASIRHQPARGLIPFTACCGTWNSPISRLGAGQGKNSLGVLTAPCVSANPLLFTPLDGSPHMPPPPPNGGVSAPWRETGLLVENQPWNPLPWKLDCAAHHNPQATRSLSPPPFLRRETGIPRKGQMEVEGQGTQAVLDQAFAPAFLHHAGIPPPPPPPRHPHKT